MNSIQLIENCSEIGAGTRGASMGIDALRIASLNLESDYFTKYPSSKIKDRNELLYEKVSTPSAKRIQGIIEVYEAMMNKLSECYSNNKFPVVLAADHSSAGGTIAGIRKQFPEKRIGVIWIDAHGDLHSPYTSPTGNVHGMPLAVSLNEDNLDCKIREVEEETQQHWSALKNMGGTAPKVLVEDLVFFGVRDTEHPEDQLMERNGIKNYSVQECRDKGIENVAKEALERLNCCEIIYISFDVDSMDCDEVSYGTGTPVKNGFFPKEAESLINSLIESQKIVCFEMVEINPTLDNKGNFMAETSFQILESVTKQLEKFALS